jgi:hypothetical protein
MIVDPLRHIHEKRDELIRQAEHQRLVDGLPHQPSVLRKQLARACARLAEWIDENDSALRPPPSSRDGSRRLQDLRRWQVAARTQAEWN